MNLNRFCSQDMPKGPYYQSCAGCSLENGAPGHCSLVCQSCMGNGYLVTQTISAGDPRTATSAHSSNGQIIGRLTKFRIDMRDCPYNLVQDVDGKLECFLDIPPTPAPPTKQNKKGEEEKSEASKGSKMLVVAGVVVLICFAVGIVMGRMGYGSWGKAAEADADVGKETVPAADGETVAVLPSAHPSESML